MKWNKELNWIELIGTLYLCREEKGFLKATKKQQKEVANQRKRHAKEFASMTKIQVGAKSWLLRRFMSQLTRYLIKAELSQN